MTAATLVQATSLWTTSPPVAITERLTLPVLAAGGEPAMIVPRLERPGAEGAPGAGALRLHDWADRTDPYAAAPLLRPEGRYGISDSAWAMHLVGLQRTLPKTSYVSLTESMPMLLAVKDADELARMADAGASADAAYEEIDRAGHLPSRGVRGPDRGHRDGHRRRRAATQQHQP